MKITLKLPCWMANNQLLVDEKQTDLGNFMVGRLLPIREKRQVGPFTFIDHMGPAVLGDGKYVDVDQHPHIGLSTLTYLFEGEIHHRDSTGSDCVIAPGDVGFMTAGSGVSHTERTPEFRRTNDKFTMHGYQIWVAMPKELEEIEPNFAFYGTKELPQWQDNGVHYKLVAGAAFDKTSPLKGYSPLFMVDLKTEEATTVDLGGEIEGEVAFVIVKGSISHDEQTVHAGQMLVSKTKNHCKLNLGANTQILLFGGQPLPEEHFLLWNFVPHSKERLQKAKQDWINKKFPVVPNDNSYIDFPKLKRS